jgi:hypothetical protein
MSSWDDERRAFADAAAWFADLTALVGNAWSRPGLGEWDVRALVGHTSRALLTVESYLQRPASSVEVGSPVAYYRATRPLVGGPEVVRRGRAAGWALGADPAAGFRAVVDRVVPLLDDRDGSELVTTLVGGMALRDYLPTRVFELVVHGADLAVAVDLPLDVPPGPASRALALVDDLTLAEGLAATVLRAVTGRTGLPDGFTLL